MCLNTSSFIESLLVTMHTIEGNELMLIFNTKEIVALKISNISVYFFLCHCSREINFFLSFMNCTPDKT